MEKAARLFSEPASFVVRLHAFRSTPALQFIVRKAVWTDTIYAILTLSWESRDLGSLRLRHRRRGVGGLRAGRSAYRRPFGQGAAAGGRRLGSQPLDPHPAGLAAVVPAPHERLDVFLGARA